jgi:hypothetical protein
MDIGEEHIYFAATNDRGERIPYRGGPDVSMMMGDIYHCPDWSTANHLEQLKRQAAKGDRVGVVRKQVWGGSEWKRMI